MIHFLDLNSQFDLENNSNNQRYQVQQLLNKLTKLFTSSENLLQLTYINILQRKFQFYEYHKEFLEKKFNISSKSFISNVRTIVTHDFI